MNNVEKIIVPLYNAEQIYFNFNTNPAVRFEKWNRQIETMTMGIDESEHIPDAVAIFEEPTDPNQSIETLHRIGFNILPLIFGKAYFKYQIANEKKIIQRWSTSFSKYKKGWTWIDINQLQIFLDTATSSLRTCLNISFH